MIQPGLFVEALHAARLLRRQPRFAAAAILQLAVGIGAAVFPVVNAALLTDMPFPDPDRLGRREFLRLARRAGRHRTDPALTVQPLLPPDRIAMLLAILGTYALAAFAAGARRRELIRSAFGATRRSLTQLMLRGALPGIAGGIVAGLAAAFGAARALTDMLFATSPGDPEVYVLVAGALLAVTAGAIWLPARRAAGAAPSAWLRG